VDELSGIGIAAGWFISWMLGVASLVGAIVILKEGCEFEDRLAALFPTCRASTTFQQERCT
jgi:hypothetical protein